MFLSQVRLYLGDSIWAKGAGAGGEGEGEAAALLTRQPGAVVQR